jgi:hypothetical protein
MERLDDRLNEFQEGQHDPPKMMDFPSTAAYPP